MHEKLRRSRLKIVLMVALILGLWLPLVGGITGVFEVNGAKAVADTVEKETIRIHDIQGEGHETPMMGEFVKDVKGIVTYQYAIGDANYFHMQTPEEDYDGNPKTSEGIVVYTGHAEDVEIGDLVSVSGKVDEYYIEGYSDREETDLPVTQMNARGDHGGKIVIKDTDVKLPKPIQLTSSDIPTEVVGEKAFDDFEPENNAIDFWESMEGMRVEVAPSKVIAPQSHGDLIVVTDEIETDTTNGGIRLTENGQNAQIISLKLFPNNDARDVAVKTGDLLTEPLTGVVNYSFSNYKVYVDLKDFEEAFEEGNTKLQPTTIDKHDNKLTIASYNVENFSANTNPGETPDEKAKNIARAFVQDMDSPDIIGVIEIQDNNGQAEGPGDADASRSYGRLIETIQDVNGPEYRYVNINPEYNADGGASHGNIRVGFLYNPDRVTLAESKDGHGEATEPTVYRDDQLTLNPGRVYPNHDAFANTRKPLAAQFKFQGESVVVVANHFNAKLRDDPVFGQNQPPHLETESQRIDIAHILNDFVQDIEKDYPDEHVVVLGDMNDFEFSNALDVLAGDELTNMIKQVPEEERYSYIHDGHSQVLDHILVSNHLAKSTEIDIIHINADFTDMHGRASDHDPVLIQMDLNINRRMEESSESDELEDDPTETFTFTYLLIGCALLLVVGAIVMYIRRRQK